MKKFISLVMAAAMTVSLMPTIAFARTGEVTASAKIVNAWEEAKDFEYNGVKGAVIDSGSTSVPELQLKITDVEYEATSGSTVPELDFTIILDNAKFADANGVKLGTGQTAAEELIKLISINPDGGSVQDFSGATITGTDVKEATLGNYKITVDTADVEDDEFTFTLTGVLAEKDVIAIDMQSLMTNAGANRKATVSVESKAIDIDNLTYVSVLDKGITATVRKTVSVAEDEVTKLNSRGLKIASTVGSFVTGQTFEIKLSKGFEFTNKTVSSNTALYTFDDVDDNTLTVTYRGSGDDEFTIAGDDIEIEATSAKSGSTATMTVKAVKSSLSGTFSATTTVEVVETVDYKVELSVDDDEDVPVIYSGTDIDNTGITDDSDHWSLEITAEETFPGAWSMRQGFNFNLPEGVYVTDVEIVDAENFYQNGVAVSNQKGAWEDAFYAAYQNGDHENFEFKKRVFDDVNSTLADDPAKLTFKLQLVADPTFEGDVVLTLEGALVDTKKVTIAEFVKPYTVTAQQNDVIIDYRNTAVNTPIVVKEAEDGLWDDKNAAVFTFTIDRGDIVQFEDDATFTIDKDSDLDITDFTNTDGSLGFKVKSTSDSAATVTISDIELFMNRSIPAGAYKLTVSTSMSEAYEAQLLYAPDDTSAAAGNYSKTHKEDSYVGDLCDYDDVVNAAFINVVTSGRDQDNLFTTKVTVPVGENYIIAGTEKIDLDVPAYITADGYTMLPVRAVSKALGINTNNVIWDASTRTVTIMYGQRVITMTIGSKTVTVNGSNIPTSAAPEITNGRTFLPLRDLATALGVSDINWDASTRTATLN